MTSWRRAEASRRSLPSRGLATLTPGGLLLGRRSALLRASARPELLAPAARGAWRVRDPRGALLRHTLALQGLVLLLALHARSLIGHLGTPLGRCVWMFRCSGKPKRWLMAEHKGIREVCDRGRRNPRTNRSSRRWANPP